jgi:hypothetical protein
LAFARGGKRCGMRILSKRNALIGWVALFFVRRYAKRRLRVSRS